MKRLRYVRLSAGRRAAIWGVFLLAAVMGLMCVAVLHMKPILTNLAAASVSNTVNRIVVTAVYDAVSAGEVDYDDLVHLEKDQSGHLSEVSTRELEIPVGTLTGSSLLAGRGPCIRIRMQAVGSTTAKLRNAFTAAGINQTKHQILLDVTVQMSILLPGFRTSTQVSNEITVAETIIIGSVPDTYTYFSTTPEETEQYAEDYILNNG